MIDCTPQETLSIEFLSTNPFKFLSRLNVPAVNVFVPRSAQLSCDFTVLSDLFFPFFTFFFKKIWSFFHFLFLLDFFVVLSLFIFVHFSFFAIFFFILSLFQFLSFFIFFDVFLFFIFDFFSFFFFLSFFLFFEYLFIFSFLFHFPSLEPPWTPRAPPKTLVSIRKKKERRKKNEPTETGPVPQSHAQDLFVNRVRGNPSLRPSGFCVF